MSTADYETIFQEARQLPAEAQRRLRDELTVLVEQTPPRSGANFVAYLESLPFDETDLLDIQRMEQAIEEGCERIEPSI